MALYIKDPEADRLARQLAAMRGESITQTIINALHAQLKSTTPPKSLAAKRKEVMAILDRCYALPVLDNRSADEILGYDEHGLPS